MHSAGCDSDVARVRQPLGEFTVVSTTFSGTTTGIRTTEREERAHRVSFKTPALLATVLTGALVIDALIQPIAPFDLWSLNQIQRIDLPYLETILRPVDALTSSTGAIGSWALVLLAFIIARKWLVALAVMALPVGGLINNFVGEVLVGRTRPHGYDEIVRTVTDVEAASFPSGHVMGAVMLYGLLFFLAREIRNRPLALVVQSFSMGIILVVGFARVWYGAHWPSDVLGAYALGGLILVGILAAYQRIQIAVGEIPFIRAAFVQHDEREPHAHALTSLVIFNGDTVSKIYAPGFVPRAIYWLAYQAEFPYIRNRVALQAALERRNLASQLSEYWFGSSRVALATSVDTVHGRYALNSTFVDGHEPTDRAAAKAFLVEVRGRFEEAGLPTWQIDPRQPRAIDNVLETAAGDYTIVDLESGLVSPLASLKTWARAIRRGMVPIYDDVYFDVTRGYIEREAEAMREVKGTEWLARLREQVERAETETRAWHAGELRIWSKLVGGIWDGYGFRTWRSRAQARVAGGQDKALGWMTASVENWLDEGRITGKRSHRAARADGDTNLPGGSAASRSAPGDHRRPALPVRQHRAHGLDRLSADGVHRKADGSPDRPTRLEADLGHSLASGGAARGDSRLRSIRLPGGQAGAVEPAADAGHAGRRHAQGTVALVRAQRDAPDHRPPRRSGCRELGAGLDDRAVPRRATGGIRKRSGTVLCLLRRSGLLRGRRMTGRHTDTKSRRLPPASGFSHSRFRGWFFRIGGRIDVLSTNLRSGAIHCALSDATASQAGHNDEFVLIDPIMRNA